MYNCKARGRSAIGSSQAARLRLPPPMANAECFEMRRTTLLMLLPLLFCAQLSAADPAGKPGKMYKWVDENGVVHYSEKPVDDATAEEVAIRRGPAPAPAPAAAPAADPEKQARCARLRANVRLLEANSPDLQITENGLSRPLTEAERKPQLEAALAGLKDCPEEAAPAE